MRHHPVERAKLTKTSAYYLGFIALGMSFATLGPTLPGLAEQTGKDLGDIGFLFIVRGIGYMMGAILGGRLYDRMPGHPVMGGALMVMVAMLVIVPLVPLLTALALVFVLLGMGEGMLDVGGNTLLVWVHGKDVDPFMNGLHLFFGLGAFIAPILVAQAALRSDDLTLAYWALALLVLPAALYILRLGSPPIRTTLQEDTDKPIDYTLVTLLAGLLFLNVGVEASFGGWIFSYARELELASEGNAYLLNSTFWGVFTFGRLVGIPLAARFRPRTILLADALLTLVAALLIALWVTPTTLWIATIGVGFGLASFFPTVISFGERQMTLTGKITSLFFVGTSLAGMSFPSAAGFLFDELGPQSMMWMMVVAAIVTLGLYGYTMVYIHRPKHPELMLKTS